MPKEAPMPAVPGGARAASVNFGECAKTTGDGRDFPPFASPLLPRRPEKRAPRESDL